MTRGTNLMQQLWFITINDSTCFRQLYALLQECKLCAAAAYRFLINRMLSLPLNEVRRHKEWRNIRQTAHNNNIPIHLLTKLRRNIQKKTRPTTPPHCFHTEHKMAHLHTLLTICQKNHQSLQNHKCQSYLQKQQHNCATHQTIYHNHTLPYPTWHERYILINM